MSRSMARVLHTVKVFQSFILHSSSGDKFRRDCVEFGCKFENSHRGRRDEQGQTLLRLMVGSLLVDLPNVTMQGLLKAGSGVDTKGYIQAAALNSGLMKVHTYIYIYMTEASS